MPWLRHLPSTGLVGEEETVDWVEDPGQEDSGKTAGRLINGVWGGHAAGRQSLTGSLMGRGRAVLSRVDLTCDLYRQAVQITGSQGTEPLSSSHVMQVVVQGEA